MDQILSSWKEIATFMGKGVRTVQRWEKQLDFPVHRPPGGLRHVVFARAEELKAWMERDRREPLAAVKVALLLGNDHDLRATVRHALEDQGFVVLHCRNEQQASFFLRLKPKLDLLLVGREVERESLSAIEKLLSLYSDVRVLVVSGSCAESAFEGRDYVEVPRGAYLDLTKLVALESEQEMIHLTERSHSTQAA